MPHEINFGKKLLEVRQTPVQFWLKRARDIFLSVAIPFVVIALILAIFSAQFTWPIIIVAVIVFVSSAMLILLHKEMPEHVEATLHEDGLAYTIGGKTTKIAFSDVKAAQFTAIENAGGLKGYFSKDTRSAALIKHDGTRFEMDGYAAVFENFRRFYQKLDSVFADYLLRDVTNENIHLANISFGDRLELKDGRFVYHEKIHSTLLKRAMPLEDITSVEQFFDHLLLKARLHEGEAIEFSDIPLQGMLNIQAFYRVVKMTKAQQVVNVSNEEYSFGKKLFEIRQTLAQLWLRKARNIFLSVTVSSIVVVLILAIFSVQFTWPTIIVAAVIIASSAMLILLHIKMPEHVEATLYEDGLVYILGGKTTKVAFSNVKATQFEAMETAGGVKDYIFNGTTRSAALIKRNGTRFEMDGYAAVFENFRRFYQKLDSVFADYLLRDVTHENIHLANISFGEHLELRDGCFIYHEKKLFTPAQNRVMPLENISSVERLYNYLFLKGLREGEAVEFAELSLKGMFNVQAFYRVVKMTKAQQVLNVSQVTNVSNKEYDFGKKLFEVRQTQRQLLLRRLWVILWSGFFPCITGILLLLGGVMGYSLHTAAFIIILAFFAALPLPKALKIKHSEAVLYENGLIYVLGDKTTKVAFKDVKSTQYRISAGWSGKSIIAVRSVQLIKNDGSGVEIDADAAVLRDFRQFYERLALVFADYLLRGITSENLHQVNIDFGSSLKLRNGLFFYTKNPFDVENENNTITMPIESVTGIERRVGWTSIEGFVCLKGPLDNGEKATDFAVMYPEFMFNTQALYRVVEMAKQRQEVYT